MKRNIIFLLLCLASISVLFAATPEDPAAISDNDPATYSMVTNDVLTASVDLTALVPNVVSVGFSKSALASTSFDAYDKAAADICNQFILDKITGDTVYAETKKPYYLRWKLYSTSNIKVTLKAKAPMASTSNPVVNINWKVSSIDGAQYSGGTDLNTASTEYDKKITATSYAPGIGVSGSFGFNVKTETLINKPTGKTYKGIILAEVTAE